MSRRAFEGLSRTYGFLLRAYTPRFRRHYGPGMVEAFRVRCVRAARGGRLRLVLWVVVAVADVLWNASLERVTAWRARRSSADPMLAGVRRNIRFAFRLVVRQPTFSATLVGTLALGTGATAAFFGVVDAALLRPLPYPDADRLVSVRAVDPELGPNPLAAPYLQDLRERVTTLQSLVGFSPSWDLTLTDPGEPRRVFGAYVSDGLFELLGTSLAAGRTFDPTEHASGGPPAVVVSERFWDRHFGSDTPLDGQAVTLDDTRHTVVGIAPDLRLPITSSLVSRSSEAAELWLPFAQNPYAELRSVPVMNVVARLPPGVSLDGARAELEAVGRALREEVVDGEGLALSLSRLDAVVTEGTRATVLTLFGGAAFLLLIACANVANLLLARATGRRRELAIRHSLGAGRRQLLSQLLTESFVIAVLGGALGLVLAWGLISFATAAGLPGLPPTADVRVDLRVAVCATVLIVGTTVVFGLAPAIRVSSAASVGASGASGGATPGEGGLRRALVTAEVALAVTLLVGAGLLGRSFWNLVNVDPGFQAEGLLQVPVSLNGDRYSNPGDRLSFLEELLPDLSALPGVSSVAAVNRLPLGGSNVLVGVEVDGVAPPEGGPPLVDRRVATPGYFETMGIPVVEGRGFTRDDRAADAGPVAVVNEAFARLLLDGTALGRRTRLMLRSGPGPWISVIGVVTDVRHHGLDRPVEPEIYVPYAQAPVETMSALVRTTADPSALAPAAREIVWRLDPNLALDGTGPVSEIVRGTVEEPRFRTLVLNGFAALALLLAAVGIYGVMSYAVARRTRETGIRVALGAERVDVIRQLVGQGLASTVWGLLLGCAGGALVSQVLTGFLFGVGPLDPVVFGSAAALLFLVAVVASYLPARRAAGIDTVRAIATE